MHILFVALTVLMCFGKVHGQVVPCLKVFPLFKQPGLEVTLKTSHERYLPGEILEAAFVVRNLSAAPILIPQLVPEEFALEVLVRNDNYKPPAFFPSGLRTVGRESDPSCTHPIRSLAAGEIAKLSWSGEDLGKEQLKRDPNHVVLNGLRVMSKPGPGRIRVPIYGHWIDAGYVIDPFQIDSVAYLGWKGVEKGKEYPGFRALVSVPHGSSWVLAMTNLIYPENWMPEVSQQFAPKRPTDPNERWGNAQFIRIAESDRPFEFEALVKSQRGIVQRDDLRIRTGGSELLLNRLLERADAARRAFRTDPLGVKAIDWKSIR